uniref:Uncharacterized protein n=1 Tax=Daphnia magna TaxID=35525 RepID=A0A0P6F6I5_9CRUS
MSTFSKHYYLFLFIFFLSFLSSFILCPFVPTYVVVCLVAHFPNSPNREGIDVRAHSQREKEREKKRQEYR